MELKDKLEEKFKRIPPENVRKDNKNLYRYSPELAKEMWKCRGNQNSHKESHAPKNLMDYVILQRILEKDLEDPYPKLDFNLDFEKFINVYADQDQIIFKLWIQGYTQQEIADRLGMLQSNVSMRLAFLKEEFIYFYNEEWIDER